MFRCTTPTLTFVLPFEAENVNQAIVTVKARDVTINRYLEECSASGNQISCRLTQAETSMFRTGDVCKVQLRIQTNSGECMASQIYITEIEETLNDEVIE